MRTPPLLYVLVLSAACGSVDLTPVGDAVSGGDGSIKTDADSLSDTTPGPGEDGTVSIGDDAGGDANDSTDGGQADIATTDAEDDVLESPTDAEDVAAGEDVPSDAASDTPVTTESQCPVIEGVITCAYETKTLTVGAFLESRDVLYAVPDGDAPAGGFPVVLLFHGTGVNPEYFWEGEEDGAFGLAFQVGTVRALLDGGFAVLTPRAQVAFSYWNTNVTPWNYAWTSSPDHEFMTDLLAAIDVGDFGKLNADRLYAGGASSGGYMSSRMGLTYPGFRALAIHSASYMICAAAFCSVPELEKSHPPTLFLHGELDAVVPISTMYLYRDALTGAEVETKTVTDPLKGHEWLSVAPAEILAWFEAHP